MERPVVPTTEDLHSPNNVVVKMAEQQLRQRFVGLDKENQISVLKHHLQRGKSCRDLAYIRLLSYWDEAFVPIITELWEAYHEENCSWVIIKNYPLDFVKKHKEKLIAAGSKRKFIVQRLCENPDYRLSHSNLSDYDYLWLVSVTKRSISDTKAKKEILWATVKDICQSPIPRYIVYHVGSTILKTWTKFCIIWERWGKRK